MSARTDTVLDEYDRPVPGASVYVYNADGTDASIFSDKAQLLPIVQPVQTDEFGVFTYYAEDGYYREDIWYGGKLRYRQSGVAIGVVANILIDAVARAENDAAIAAAAAALIGAGGIGFTVDSNLVVRPENNGGTTAIGLAAACAAASAASGEVALSPNTTYTIDREVVVPTGVNIRGPASAVIKLRNQITTTLTSGFSTGTGAKTFNVANASAFVVGQTVMFVNTTSHTTSPTDPFSHAGRQISAISGNSVTIAAGPTVAAGVVGDVMASTCHLLRCMGNNTLQGFTVDGNEANNLYAHWITSALIAQEGDGVRKLGLIIQNTPSDAFLCGGPNAGEIAGSWTLHCKFLNIGGNGIHYGNARDFFAIGNRMKDGNMRYFDPVEQGGGGGAGLGHQDGAIIYSDNCYGLTATANVVENFVKGVGALGTTPGNVNDKATVVGNTFINCYRPLEVTSHTQQVIFTGNRCISTFPFLSGGMRFDSQTIYIDLVAGASLYTLVTKPQGIIIANNYIKNGTIRGIGVDATTVSNNILDNRDMNDAANTGPRYYSLDFQTPSALQVQGNTIRGGYIGLSLNNSQSALLGQDILVEGNLFQNQYQTAIDGGTTGGPTEMLVRGNGFRASSVATKDDNATALPISASWSAVVCRSGMVVDGNRVEFDVGSAAFVNSNNAAFFGRLNNVVNGVREVPSSFANDGAASAGGVPVGGTYRNGSALQQRVS